MKKLIITCALITSASRVSFAQSQQPANQAPSVGPSSTANRPMPTPEFMAQRRTTMYERQLNLTPEQSKSVYDVELNFVKQEQAVRANGGQPDMAQHQQMMMAKDEQFKKILTADQYTKYDALRPRPGVQPVPGTPAPGTPAPANK